MILIKEFKAALEEFKNDQDRISIALVLVTQKAIQDDLNTELREFHKWFEELYFEDGEKIVPFSYPVIDESPVLEGGKPHVYLRGKNTEG